MLDSITSDELADYLARVALQDRKAFSRLYELTSAKLFAVSVRMMRTQSEAEDLLQEAYIRIWHKADSFRPGQGNPLSWMIAITRNLAIDRLRTRSLPIAPIEMAEDVADNRPTPETAYGHTETRAAIDLCMEQLEAKRAEAVRAAYLEGWSYQELADRFDTPLNTMRTWLRRSLLRLRECLEHQKE